MLSHVLTQGFDPVAKFSLSMLSLAHYDILCLLHERPLLERML